MGNCPWPPGLDNDGEPCIIWAVPTEARLVVPDDYPTPEGRRVGSTKPTGAIPPMQGVGGQRGLASDQELLIESPSDHPD